MFACLAQPHDHAPRQQCEIAGVDRQANAGRGGHDSVEAKVAEPEQPTFLPSNPPHVHDIEALQMFLDEAGNRFGRILQVAVHDDNHVAARMVERGTERRLVAEVSRESHHSNLRMRRDSFRQQCRSAIRAPVVDDDDFVGTAWQRVEYRRETTQQLGENGLFVVDGDGRRHSGGSGHRGLPLK